MNGRISAAGDHECTPGRAVGGLHFFSPGDRFAYFAGEDAKSVTAWKIKR